MKTLLKLLALMLLYVCATACMRRLPNKNLGTNAHRSLTVVMEAEGNALDETFAAFDDVHATLACGARTIPSQSVTRTSATTLTLTFDRASLPATNPSCVALLQGRTKDGQSVDWDQTPGDLFASGAISFAAPDKPQTVKPAKTYTRRLATTVATPTPPEADGEIVVDGTFGGEG